MSGVAGHYDDWAPTYDSDPNPTRDLKDRVLAERLEGLSCEHVIEIGCGSGRQTLLLARRCRRVTALDLSPGMLALARERVPDPAVRFLQADLRKPWPLSKAADLILAALVLEHIEDCGPFFREAARLLRPGGRLLLCEYHPARQALGKQARYRREGEEIRIPAWRHTEEEFIGLARTAGLQLELRREHACDNAEKGSPPRLLQLEFRLGGD